MAGDSRRSRSRSPSRREKSHKDSEHRSSRHADSHSSHHNSHRHRHSDDEGDERRRKHRREGDRDETEEERKERKRLKKEKKRSKRDGKGHGHADDDDEEDDENMWVEKGADAVSPNFEALHKVSDPFRIAYCIQYTYVRSPAEQVSSCHSQGRATGYNLIWITAPGTRSMDARSWSNGQRSDHTEGLTRYTSQCRRLFES